MAKILVIDDDEQIRGMIFKILKQDHHDVFLAEDGEQGLLIYTKINPDLIITDIIMPNIDGIEVIIEISKINPELPIIAISGGRRAISANFNLDSAEMLGVNTILYKPFTGKDLLGAVNSLLIL
jgi:CheY-like chemotaxis protein